MNDTFIWADEDKIYIETEGRLSYDIEDFYKIQEQIFESFRSACEFKYYAAGIDDMKKEL